MKAEIITIGDEILIGQIVDSNSAWIADQLTQLGIKVHQISSISDNEAHILTALSEAESRADLVIMTGGLGPTKDDITKHTLCKYFDSELVVNQEVHDDIEQFMKTRGIRFNTQNIKQAEVPDNCTVIRNYNGTASGMWFERNGCVFFSMPGVPFEMKEMVSVSLIPKIKEHFELPIIVQKTIMTHGLPESMLAELISDWEENLSENVKLAYLPSPEHVRLRLSIRGNDKKKLVAIIEKEELKLHKIIGKAIFGVSPDTLQSAVGELLRKSNKTLCTAESCTGGNIARQITSISGSSVYFKGSLIAYSNEAKEEILKINKQTMIDHGAVSQQTVEEMAKAALNMFQTDYAIAVSGIAGPDGGSSEKPVGTTWIAVASRDKIESKKYVFGQRRDINIRRASAKSLDKLRKFILEI